MSNDGKIISIIKNYRAEMPVPYNSSWPEIEFDKAAYSIWAIDELITYINDHPDMDVYKAIYSFKNMMLDYSCVVTNYSDANFMFDIAHDAIVNVLDVIAAAS